MKLHLNSGEQIVKDSQANLQRGLETVGGWLYLTNQRLVFESHGFNIQNEPTEIAISSIDSTQPVWTKFLGFLPIFPNSLAVIANGTQYNFVLGNRTQWASAIATQSPSLGA